MNFNEQQSSGYINQGSYHYAVCQECGCRGVHSCMGRRDVSTQLIYQQQLSHTQTLPSNDYRNLQGVYLCQ